MNTTYTARVKSLLFVTVDGWQTNENFGWPSVGILTKSPMLTCGLHSRIAGWEECFFDGSLIRSQLQCCQASTQSKSVSPVLVDITRARVNLYCISLSALPLLWEVLAGEHSRDTSSIHWSTLQMAFFCTQSTYNRIYCSLRLVDLSARHMNSRIAS